MKKVVIVSSTPRDGGNSELLAVQFARGARDAGHIVETQYLRDFNIGYCRGCYSCAKSGRCFQSDGMNSITQSLLTADVILLSTPVYFYAMSGQLKVFIDRLLPVYSKIRADIYLICTSYDTDDAKLEQCIENIRGATRDCFENCPEKGILKVGGLDKAGEIKKRPELKTAYEMGKNC